MTSFVRSRYGPSHPLIGSLVEKVSLPLLRWAGLIAMCYGPGGAYAARKGRELRDRINRGETIYLLGIGPSGHNSAAALVEVSRRGGIHPISNNEEERFSGRRHDDQFPARSIESLLEILAARGATTQNVLAVLTSWDYAQGLATCLRAAAEEFPAGLCLSRKASSPQMNPWHFVDAFRAPARLAETLRFPTRVPVIGMRHHDNHAYWAYAVSPFAGNGKDTIITVIDGFGDDASMSIYVANGCDVRRIRRARSLFDSLGMLYSVISSTQGGWTTLSSEGRFMGAAAWGDRNRLSNPFYRRLRQILLLEEDGRFSVNRSLINYHRRGLERPYAPGLDEILGSPIAQCRMWNPDAVFDVDAIANPPATQERVDKAAALQMVFEDALFHVVDGMIRATGSQQLILSGGTALNCIANMRLLEHFDEGYYRKSMARERSRLHLWVPPNPSDTGTAMGAAYQFAMRNGAPLGPKMTHAFLCGSPPSEQAIREALRASPDVGSRALGNVEDPSTLARVARLVSLIVAGDGVLGIYQGAAETGPRALGHRSILANPCNPMTRDVLNERVKFRERLRPLAPMLTLAEATRLFDLSEGASDDQYNAYNYMVLTAQARPEARRLVPAVIHEDGTSRLQIVRRETDRVSYAILKALGERIGVEAAVNTSLNVGAPICQSPQQALATLQRARGMTGLLMIAETGEAFLAWDETLAPHKDGGQQLTRWLEAWDAVETSNSALSPGQTR
jgi:carbamoyltransferase